MKDFMKFVLYFVLACWVILIAKLTGILDTETYLIWRSTLPIVYLVCAVSAIVTALVVAGKWTGHIR